MSLDVSLYIDVDVGVKEKKSIRLFGANITHNLTDMADKAGIYKHLWRPEELDIKYAKDLIETIEYGLEFMKANPGRFKEFDAPNGWGTYEQFIPWIEEYLKACKEYPKAYIEISR